MTIKWERGFRRIGWVVTLPLVAAAVFIFKDRTEDFVGYNRQVIEAQLPDLPKNSTVTDKLPDEDINPFIKLAKEES